MLRFSAKSLSFSITNTFFGLFFRKGANSSRISRIIVSCDIFFKYFSKKYNLLLLDLRGHGKSKSITLNPFKKKYTFNSITNDILEVIDAEKIKKSHFVGISLGTILIRNFAEKNPKRVQSLVMGGAIMKLNLRSKILMFLGNSTKSVLPYMWIYNLLAYIIMPNKNHKESRLLFINEAKK